MANTVAIMGLGLMGGSLGLGLRALPGERPQVRAYARRQETRDQAEAMGVADSVYDDPVACCEGADLIVLCVPIYAMPALLKDCLPGIGPGAVITDVGSTKQALCEQLGPMLGDACFVGSHPIAGSEVAGISAARENLYRDAIVVVTPDAAYTDAAIDKVSAFWASLGCTVMPMSAQAHDQMLARTSHLPHLAAAVLTQSVLRENDPDAAAFCGSGFKDTTRIAAGSEDIWSDIVKSNKDAILEELEAMQSELERFRVCVAEGQDGALHEYLRAARLKRAAVDDECPKPKCDAEGAHE